MISIEKKEMCCGCSACAMICPQKCISMEGDKFGFEYPIIDNDRCINCGLCENVCPQINELDRIGSSQVDAFAGVCGDLSVRNNSSSGGMFYLISREIISRGGVVFGAAFDESFYSVKHIVVESLEDLKRLQGSKYLQSKISDSYAKVKAYLENNRCVLFTGTPCQINGLKMFLKKDYDNLFLQDIVCHGVPSPSVWKEYISDLEKKYSGRAINVSFRDKSYGWREYLIRIGFDNGKSYTNNRSDDLFMRGFLHNYYLRSSCYHCRHKGENRLSDITLADFWGVENVCPRLDDGKGTSLIIVHTSKGRNLLQKIECDVELEKVSFCNAIFYNPSFEESAKKNARCELFEKEVGKKKIGVLLKKFCSRSLYRKITYKLGQIALIFRQGKN